MRSPKFQIRAVELMCSLLIVMGMNLALATTGWTRVEPEPTVTISSVLGEGDDVRGEVEATLLADLEGTDLSTPDGQPIVITISEASHDAMTLQVGFQHAGEEVYTWVCECSGLELQEQLPGRTREALRVLWGTAQRTEAAPLPRRPVLSPDPSEARRFERGLGMLGAGIALTSFGLTAAIAGGSAMGVRAAARANLPTWAIISVAAGGATAAVGVPLLIVGARRTRASDRAVLRVVPSGSGLVLRGRF